MSDEPMVACPACGLELPESDGWAQKAHMEAEHPEIVEQRLRDAGMLPRVGYIPASRSTSTRPS